MTLLHRLNAVLVGGGRQRRPTLRLLALASVALTLLVAACEDDATSEEDLDALPTAIGTADISSGEADVQFVFSDTSIEPAMVTVQPAGVVFSLRNDGTREHEFVIVDSEDTYQVDQLPLVEGSIVNLEDLTVLGEVEPFPPGESRTATAELESGKRYIVFCNIPGHYQAGVRAEVEVAGD